jgi:hypothetical protein
VVVIRYKVKRLGCHFVISDVLSTVVECDDSSIVEVIQCVVVLAVRVDDCIDVLNVLNNAEI